MLDIRGVSKMLGGRPVLSDISLTIQHQEFFALLGPSGCGKTTLLRIIAGLETPDRGDVYLEDKSLAAMSPSGRPFNLVFQKYALFPHLDVAGNVGFGLRFKSGTQQEKRAKIEEMLALVGLSGMEKRAVTTLSGGQQQRVALARALILRPRILLLDEPMAALDPKLRQKMQEELKAIQRRLGMTFVMVTHDQDEALMLADRIAVMDQGRLQHVGPAEDVYQKPCNAFVAHFVGLSNEVPVVVRNVDGPYLTVESRSGGHGFRMQRDDASWAAWRPGDQLRLFLRPEQLQLSTSPLTQRPNAVRCTVLDRLYHGSTSLMILRPESGDLPDLRCLVLGDANGHLPSRGATCYASWSEQAGHLVKDETP